MIVYGDVNSTVAAALVAAKRGITLAHVEAGLRSFDRTMPEEINRVVTDRLSDLLRVTSMDAIDHLSNEGVPAERIHFVGNPMIDTLLAHLDRFDRCRRRQYDRDPYVVVTVHRPSNVDDPADAAALVDAYIPWPTSNVILPLHPRGRQRLAEAGLMEHPQLLSIDPVGYFEFLGLVRGAAAVVTDSGGVQEETTVLGIPCLTLRPNTERPVTITSRYEPSGDPPRCCGSSPRNSCSRKAVVLADTPVMGWSGRTAHRRGPSPGGRRVTDILRHTGKRRAIRIRRDFDRARRLLRTVATDPNAARAKVINKVAKYATSRVVAPVQTIGRPRLPALSIPSGPVALRLACRGHLGRVLQNWRTATSGTRS